MDSIELFPTSKMTFSHKIIVTIRLVIILSILGYLITTKQVYLWMGVFTSAAFGGVYYYREYVDTDDVNADPEPFVNITTKSTFDKQLSTDYFKGTSTNPMSNVLLTDYIDDPTRKPAPPTFADNGIGQVNESVKNTIQELNPTIEDTSSQLFSGLYGAFQLDTANRPFFSTPNTKIPNDQDAFAQYLYGSMKSCKEDGIQCIKDNPRYNLY
jgi:hypothetical protein